MVLTNFNEINENETEKGFRCRAQLEIGQCDKYCPEKPFPSQYWKKNGEYGGEVVKYIQEVNKKCYNDKKEIFATKVMGWAGGSSYSDVTRRSDVLHKPYDSRLTEYRCNILSKTLRLSPEEHNVLIRLREYTYKDYKKKYKGPNNEPEESRDLFLKKQLDEAAEQCHPIQYYEGVKQIPRIRRELSPIKCLHPFTAKDADLFRLLQRQVNLNECFRFITDGESKFGIMYGESGCGKTSFIQAGLITELESNDYLSIYVKFSNLDPMESIHQALVDQSDLNESQVDKNNFFTTLERLSTTRNQPFVLFFDQFEQFFVHFQRFEQRLPFIESLNKWYKDAHKLPVKVLLVLRDDFFVRHGELQRVLGYITSAQNNFELEKFTPKQATEIFKVIAKKENMPLNERDISQMIKQELAHKKDGRISPVDIQILFWIISNQTEPDKIVLDRKFFQKMGGIEGLLEKYLLKTVNPNESESQRQVVFKVLLSLIDEHVRVGILTKKEIIEKLKSESKPEQISKIIDWLSDKEVRLITPVKQGYELAHERLIIPIRKLTHKLSSEIDQADSLLSKRTNEWLGNDCHPHYLLRWGELRKINKQKNFLDWGNLREAKQELIAQSQRHQNKRIYASITPFVFLVIVWLLYLVVKDPLMRFQRKQTLKKTYLFVEGGSFMMGDSTGENDERPVHEVQIPNFRISTYEITNQQYCDFLNSINRSELKDGKWINLGSADCQIKKDEKGRFNLLSNSENLPVVCVSWFGAVAFAKYVGAQLPTEAQWEYASRGGNKSKGYLYSGSNAPGSVAWNFDNSGFHVNHVGTRACNEIGIYDMSGNVYEWCRDWYDENYYSWCKKKGVVEDPVGPASGSFRTIRGGSWVNEARYCRSADRYPIDPASFYSTIGFRLVWGP